MKNYSRKKSTPGKVAYRTPSRYKVNKGIQVRQGKSQFLCRQKMGR